MQSHQTCQGVCREVIYILCMMERHRKARSVDGCFPTSSLPHPHPPLLSLTLWVTGTETFSSSRSVSRWEGWRVLSSSEMISLFYSSLLFPRCLLSFLFFVFAQSLFHFFSFFFFFFVLVLSSSLCVFVCIGYDGWYLPGAVHGDELPERRPGSRSPRPRWPASQGPRCPPCRSTQVRKCTQTHTISHDSCCITEYVCMYVCTYIHFYCCCFPLNDLECLGTSQAQQAARLYMPSKA